MAIVRAAVSQSGQVMANTSWSKTARMSWLPCFRPSTSRRPAWASVRAVRSVRFSSSRSSRRTALEYQRRTLRTCSWGSFQRGAVALVDDAFDACHNFTRVLVNDVHVRLIHGYRSHHFYAVLQRLDSVEQRRQGSERSVFRLLVGVVGVVGVILAGVQGKGAGLRLRQHLRSALASITPAPCAPG